FNPFFIRAVIPTQQGLDAPDTLEPRFNPFFIRAVIPTGCCYNCSIYKGCTFQSLLHQGSNSNLEQPRILRRTYQRFNPFFIRAVIPTENLLPPGTAWVHVSIPSSSGQ